MYTHKKITIDPLLNLYISVVLIFTAYYYILGPGDGYIYLTLKHISLLPIYFIILSFALIEAMYNDIKNCTNKLLDWFHKYIWEYVIYTR